MGFRRVVAGEVGNQTDQFAWSSKADRDLTAPGGEHEHSNRAREEGDGPRHLARAIDGIACRRIRDRGILNQPFPDVAGNGHLPANGWPAFAVPMARVRTPDMAPRPPARTVAYRDRHSRRWWPRGPSSQTPRQGALEHSTR